MESLVLLSILTFASICAAQLQTVSNLPSCANPCAATSPTQCNLGVQDFIASISCCISEACSPSDQQQSLQTLQQLCDTVNVQIPSAASCSGPPAPGSAAASSSTSTSSSSSSASSPSISSSTSSQSASSAPSITTTSYTLSASPSARSITTSSSTSSTSSSSSTTPTVIIDSTTPTLTPQPSQSLTSSAKIGIGLGIPFAVMSTALFTFLILRHKQFSRAFDLGNAAGVGNSSHNTGDTAEKGGATVTHIAHDTGGMEDKGASGMAVHIGPVDGIIRDVGKLH